jgi:cob(I)alamin adenosyltransferase
MKHPERLLIFTGDGKGKTTAALGMALRAAGHGQAVLIVQFVKSDSTTGEMAAVARLPEVEIVQLGRGFLPRNEGPSMESHRQAAVAALAAASDALQSGRYRLVILDEVCIALRAGLLTASGVIDVLSETPPGVCVVLTGRGAPAELLDLADTVTYMRCVKHAYQQGVAAQPGVEF